MRNFLVRAATVLATAVTVGVPAFAVQPDAPAGRPVTRAEVQQKTAETFARLDTNRDGIVTQAEYDAVRTKMRGERQAARFAKIDADGNGQVSREEFTAQRAKRDGKGMRGKGGHGMRGHGMRGDGGGMGRHDGFAAMDANKDGRVTPAEASARPLAMFDAVDANKDGTVTPAERTAAHARMRAEWKARRG